MWPCGRPPGHWPGSWAPWREGFACDSVRRRERARLGDEGLSRRPAAASGALRAGAQSDLWHPCAAVPMDLATLAVDGGHLQREGFVKSQSQARDGGAVRLMVQGCGRFEETPDFLRTEDGRETVCGLGANERHRVCRLA